MDEKALKNIITRLDKLERVVFTGNTSSVTPKKTVTLPEIIRGRKLRSGQEKIAVIVGYYEKICLKNPIRQTDLKEGWKAGKFNGKYNSNFLVRAIKAGWVRSIDSDLDLSQSGESFFDGFLKNEPTKTIS